jgi:hypothetical protein
MAGLTAIVESATADINLLTNGCSLPSSMSLPCNVTTIGVRHLNKAHKPVSP